MIDLGLEPMRFAAEVDAPVVLRLRNSSGPISDVRVDLRPPPGLAVVRGSRTIRVPVMDGGAEHECELVLRAERPGRYVVGVRRIEFVNHLGQVHRPRRSAELVIDVDTRSAEEPSASAEAIPTGRTVFVSYRRDDAEIGVSRLVPLLEDAFPERVFHDRSALAPGDRFLPSIDLALDRCAVLIAVIGRRWLNARTRTGRRRLDVPDDILRREIAKALDRGIVVIPVLLDGARMPDPADLPPDLAGLSHRQAHDLPSDMSCGVDVLVDAVARHCSTLLRASDSVRRSE